MSNPIHASPVALFRRWVAKDEPTLRLADEARYEAFLSHVEQALIRFSDGRRGLVSGDVGSISFEVSDSGRVVVNVDGQMLEVKELIWHTHPMVTGPSDGDFRMLEQLNQASSVIYEAGGDPQGTRFVRKVGVK